MNPYIQSLRLRTLPLSISGIILGTGLAVADLGFQIYDLRFWLVFALAICTTLSLQILSNLSNELGDALKGTDSAQQERAAYGLQSGALTEQSIRRMIGLFIGLSVLFGSALVWVALPLWSAAFLVFLGLGLLAIIGAMTYTLGRHSYGYMGLGDLGVFVFFGLVSTLGSFYLQTQFMSWETICCGIAIGLPCVGVLNLNNIRDMKSDAGTRVTVPLKLGEHRAKVYHTILISGGWILMAIYSILFTNGWTPYLYIITLPLYAKHLAGVWKRSGRELDPMLPMLVISTFIFALLAGIGYILY